MPNVRDYFKKKEKNQSDEFRKKLMRHRLVISYRIIIGIIVVIVFLAACYISYENKIYASYEIISSHDREEIENANYVNYNGNILKYSKDGVTAFDSNNNVLWNQTYQMQDPMVDICGDYVAIGDFKGNKIYIMNSSGLQGEIELRMSIITFKIAANGMVGVILDGGDITWIHLYDKNAEQVAQSKNTMEQNGYPLSIAMSYDAKLLCVSYLYLDTNIQKDSVAFYNFGDVGQSKQDRYVSGFDYKDTVIPVVKFLDESTSVAVGDNIMVIYKGKEIPVATFELPIKDEIQGVFTSKQYIGLVFRDGSQNGKYRIEVYDTEGKLCLTQPFNIDYTDIIIHEEQILIYNNAECVLYNMKGIQKFAGEFNMPVSLVLPSNSTTRFTLVGTKTTETIRLK